MEKILVIGANGQLGSELCTHLARIHGASHVIAADINMQEREDDVESIQLDVLDKNELAEAVTLYGITQIYQLAAMLSATGERFPLKAWNLNMQGLINTLELARLGQVRRVFWPSSIAAFGPSTPKQQTPQQTVMEPNTIYGISKQAGERICEYYHDKFGIDVRSIRYPGIISYAHPPGGGTTDYAIDIFQAAKNFLPFTCFLQADTTLPMIYMPDAIRATLELMAADSGKVKVRSSYNVAAISFSPAQLAASIAKYVPDFIIQYKPDFRESIAQSWPQSLDDHLARRHWGWKPAYGLDEMVQDMLMHIPTNWPSQQPSVQMRA